jgi:hypothetical protein
MLIPVVKSRACLPGSPASLATNITAAYTLVMSCQANRTGPFPKCAQLVWAALPALANSHNMTTNNITGPVTD